MAANHDQVEGTAPNSNYYPILCAAADGKIAFMEAPDSNKALALFHGPVWSAFLGDFQGIHADVLKINDSDPVT